MSISERLSREFSGVRVRILASYVILLAVAMIVSVLVVRQVLLVRLDDRIQEDLSQEVAEFEALAGGVDPETGRKFGSDVERIFEVYLDRNIPGEGEELITVPRQGGAEYLPSERARPAAASLLDPVTTRRWRTLESVERAEVETPIGEARYVAVPVKHEGRTLGSFVVAIFPEGERDEVNEAVRIVAAVAGAVMIIGTLLAFAISGRVLAPLRDLRTTAERITGSDLSRRIDADGDDELADLAHTFNDMLDRVEHAFNSQREFIRDAGHELRTPIAIVRGHLELLASYEQTPEERTETLALVTDELDRMRRFVDDLLDLAKAERSDFLQLRTVDIATLVDDVLAKAQGLADREWRTDVSSRGLIVADPQRLTQALLALVDNAVQHTGPDDSVTVGASVNSGSARIWVEDSGPGVPEEDRERIFSRLVRGRRGASRYEGTGLGLAIVRAIAEAHGGTAHVSGEDGARFELILPTDPETGAHR
jgi:two-component system, OmpR family, sensor kinase